MSFLEFLELEERVGSFWHRLVGEKHSWPRHPQAAVSLDQVRAQLAVFFRGLGGDRGIAITAASLRSSTHRLTWKQRVGMEDERMVVSSRDEVSLSLPDMLDHFPKAGLNRDLYFWLAAFFAQLEPAGEPVDDPLRADLAFLARARRASDAVFEAFPGLVRRHAALAAALLAQRPKRPVSGVEAQVEAMVVDMLGGPAAPAMDLSQTRAPIDYKPFLPVPLWGEALHRDPEVRSDEDVTSEAGGKKEEQDSEDKRRRAERKRQDNADRNDPLMLNRFEKMLSFADMVNVNRAADDPDEEEAKKAADEMDKITISQHGKKAATKLKFDLDLPPEAMDASRLSGTHLYPEWDHRAACYHKDHCSVLVGMAPEEGENWVPDEQAKRRIRDVKRQFEALRTKALILRAQVDGSELDTEAVVRARSDLAASGQCSDRVYMQRRPMERDLAVAVLVDSSLSTDSWIEDRRVLDVEKEALAVFSHGLAACGDPFAIYGFTSRKRAWVKVDTLKDFDEPLGERVMRRIGAMKPGYYTRMGAAIRHAAKQLEDRPNRHRLLLVITDGKPNDVDHYEGRYGIEDTRKAVQEARAKGLTVFGITIDKKAQTYFPHVFGRGSFAIVHHLAQLSAALPRIYRHLAG
ncbi:MAG: VWA domain-containing protein [Rhodospirillaceae bacterium]|nr:VWA domain-containing protein [Rhodospirillales bacterium]